MFAERPFSGGLSGLASHAAASGAGVSARAFLRSAGSVSARGWDVIPQPVPKRIYLDFCCIEAFDGTWERAHFLFGLSPRSSSTTYPAVVPSEKVTKTPSSLSFSTAKIRTKSGMREDSCISFGVSVQFWTFSNRGLVNSGRVRTGLNGSLSVRRFLAGLCDSFDVSWMGHHSILPLFATLNS